MNTGPGHDRWEDAAGTYLLGALTDDDLRGYEAHLNSCPACRSEVDDLRVAVEALPFSPPPMQAPAALKARIMAEVEREAELLGAATRPNTKPAKQRSRRSWRERFGVPVGAIGALACTALLAGVALGGILFGSDDPRTVPFEVASSMANASGELEVSNRTATLVANGLPVPPSGKVYTVWLVRPGHAPEPTSALFSPRRDGSATATVTGDLEGVETVLVNTEPIGGSSTPTSKPFFTASLS